MKESRLPIKEDLEAQIAGLTVKIENLEIKLKEKDEVIKSLVLENKEFKAKLVSFIMEN